MERDRLDRKRQAQTERERQVEIAEQAVTKHFEESLRLAEEKVSLFKKKSISIIIY